MNERMNALFYVHIY